MSLFIFDVSSCVFVYLNVCFDVCIVFVDVSFNFMCFVLIEFIYIFLK
mgnify:CR=1 FL=1